MYYTGLFRQLGRTLIQKQWCYNISQVTRTKISPHLALHHISDKVNPEERGQARTLVILFPWIYASQKAINRYCALYHQYGLDVLTVKCDMKHFLWPPTARKVSAELLDYLSTNETPLNTDRFLVHSFSVGSYLYTVSLLDMMEKQAKYGPIGEKIKGQIFDSIVYGGLPKMVEAVAKSKENIPPVLTKALMKFYLTVTSPYTVKYYEKAVDFIEQAPIRSPTLFYYSLNDVMSDSNAIDKMIERWKSEFHIPVHVKCWPRSIHAFHLREHPEQYTKALQGFLKGLGYSKITD